MRFLNAITHPDRIDLIYRNADGKVMVRKAPVEFVSYHPLAQCKPHLSELRRTRAITGIAEEGEFLRLRWNSYEARKGATALDGPFANKGIKCLEADVGPLRRYTTDHNVGIAQPRIAYLDIETDSRVPFSEKENARVLCWTLLDEHEAIIAQGLLDHDTDDDERRVLNQLWEALEPYDLLVAWMSVFFGEFDFEVIRARTTKVGATEKHARRLLYLDHCKLFKRQNVTSAESGEEKRSFKLNSIAMTVLGEGKDDFDSSKTWDAWANDRDCLADGGAEPCRKCRGCLLRYNAKDTVLMPRIEAKTGYIALFQTLCDVCGVFPESRSLLPTVQVDSFMLRLGRERGFHFATKYYEEDGQAQGQYAGAFVVELKRKGIIKNVHVGDFSSMYVNIIRTWNMSPDTLCQVPLNGPLPEGVCRSPSTGVGFSTEREGILAAAVNEVLRLRKYWNEKRTSCTPNTPEWKEADRRATAYKVAGNTFYGVIGSMFSRYYDRRIAESITQNGVWLIKRTIKEVEARGWEVVYGDTDSIYITGPSEEEFRAFTQWLNAEHYPRIVRETGAPTNYNSMAYEKEMERIVFLTKKHYTGRLSHYKGKRATEDSEPVIAGLEYKRGDASRMASDMQKEVIDLLMRERCETPGMFEPILNRVLDHLLNGELSRDEIVLSNSLSNNLSEYAQKTKNDGTPAAGQPHLMLARVLMERGVINTRRIRGKLDVPAGTRIEYIVTNALTTPTEVVWVEDWKGECDRFYYWEKRVWPPTRRLLEAAFPAHDWTRYTKVRPRRKRSALRVAEGQGSLPFADAPQTGLRNLIMPFALPTNVVVRAPAGVGAPAVPTFRRKRGDLSAQPLVIRLDSNGPYCGVGEKGRKRLLSQLHTIIRQHPGRRPVELHLSIDGQAVILGLPYTVAGAPAFIEAVRSAFGKEAA